MVKRLMSLSEDQSSQKIMESARQIWLAGLGAFARMEEEGNKIFDALVKEGEQFESQAKQMADEQFNKMKERASEWRDHIEKIIEERVTVTLNRIGIPTHDDITALAERIETLQQSIKELAANR